MTVQALPISAKLCLLYNRLFSWRYRDRAEFYRNDRTNREHFIEDYFHFEFGKTPELLARFPGESIEGKAVLDFGCMYGGSTVWFARHGARKVTGIDINAEAIRYANRLAAAQADLDPDRICFRVTSATEVPLADASVDLIISEDVVEHLSEPEAVFREWHRVLTPGGRVLISFGPPWYHPHGVHLWEVFPAPWNHVLFSERTVTTALCVLKGRDIRPRPYTELGMNKMTVKRFEGLVRASPFRCLLLHPVAIWKMQFALRVPFLREFLTSQVLCVLEKVP